MKIGLAILFCMLAVLAMSSQAMTLTNITVMGADNAGGGNVTILAYFSGAPTGVLASSTATSADGKFRRYFGAVPIVNGVYSNADWNPYFTGSFVVEVSGHDMVNPPISLATTVTVVRTVNGAFNSIQVAPLGAYDPNAAWSNVDLSMVRMHSIEMNTDKLGMAASGATSATPIPCWSTT